jgi:hypothetical protein
MRARGFQLSVGQKCCRRRLSGTADLQPPMKRTLQRYNVNVCVNACLNTRTLCAQTDDPVLELEQDPTVHSTDTTLQSEIEQVKLQVRSAKDTKTPCFASQFAFARLQTLCTRCEHGPCVQKASVKQPSQLHDTDVSIVDKASQRSVISKHAVTT